jgi:hypothetical protein
MKNNYSLFSRNLVFMIEVEGKVESKMTKNTLYYGDNLDVLTVHKGCSE